MVTGAPLPSRHMRSLRGAVLALALVGSAACVLPEGGPTTADLAGFWVLVDGTLFDEPIALVPGHDITLRLAADGALGGTAACNSYGGTVEVTAGIFDLGAEIALTTMACEAPVAAAEDAYMRALRLIDSAGLTESGDLHLLGEDADLRFESRPDPGPVPPG